MVEDECNLSFTRSKWPLPQRAAEKLQRRAHAVARRAVSMRPAESMLCSGLAGCSLSCARARHAEAARSGMRSSRHVSPMVGHQAGRRELVSDV